MPIFHARIQVEFDVEVQDDTDPRDHPVLLQLADLVMPFDNATVGGDMERL